MKAAVKVAMIFVLEYFYISPAQPAKEVSRCSASAAELTKEATVTCLFPINIEQSKIDIRIHHHFLNSSEIVSHCMWVAGKLSCKQNQGYQIGNLTNQTFPLIIQHFTQNQAGNYSCHLINTDFEYETCTLEIRSDDRPTTDQLSSSTTRFSAIKETTPSQVDTAAPVVVAVSAVVVVLNIILLLWFCWRRKRQKISRTPGSDDKERANTDQRDNLINQSKEFEEPSTFPPIPSGDFTDWQTSEGQLTFRDEDRKQAPSTEVLSTSREKRDSKQTPEQSLQSVIELLKNFPQSPSFSDGPLKSTNKQNVMTKFSFRSGADGSVEIALESNLSCSEILPEQEPVSLGQQKKQQESPSIEHKEQTSPTPSKTCIVDYRETEMKTSIDVQEEQMTTDVHSGFVDPNIQAIQHESSKNLKQLPELEKPATQEDNQLEKLSSRPEVVSRDTDTSADTANEYSENPEEASKLLDTSSIVDEESQVQATETLVEPEILLSHITTATKLSEDNMELQENPLVNESASATGLLKVRAVQ